MTFIITVHRKESYPKATKTVRNMNREGSKEGSVTLPKNDSTETPVSPIGGASGSDSDGEGYGNDTVSRPSNFSSYADYTSRDVSQEIDDEDPPALSERVTTYHDDVSFLFTIVNYLLQFESSKFRKTQEKSNLPKASVKLKWKSMKRTRKKGCVEKSKFFNEL